MTNKGSYKGWDFVNIWGFDKSRQLILQAFTSPYKPPSLAWAWITIGCIAFAGVVISSSFVLYDRKKTVVVKEIVTLTTKETVYVQSPVQDLPDTLTAREREVAQLILEGKSRITIGESLFISESTVKKHIRSVFLKTKCSSQKKFIVKYK